MPVKIKTIVKGQPEIAGGGKKKYDASPVMDGDMDIDTKQFDCKFS